jgi:GNAT superfamily N-acetyltransferase
MGLSCDQCYQYSGFEAARFQNWDTPGKSKRWQSRLWNSMDSTDGWVLRGYRQGDEKQILHLFNLVFNASRNLEQWRWEFRDNPAGLAFICVAELDGEIVGHIAAIPIKMKCGDETILGAEVVDTMTHPDHRLKGMFFKLAERIHEEATGSGVSLVWGFPNQSSAPGFIKRLGWREIGTVPGLMLVLDTKPLLRLGSYMQYIRSGFLFRNWRIALSAAVALIYHPKHKRKSTNIIVNRVNAFDNRVDSLWQKASPRFRLAVAKSSEYLNWRYANHPDGYTIFVAETNGELLGFIVLRVGKPTAGAGVIVDMLTLRDQEPVIQELAATAIDFFKRQNVGAVYSYIHDEEYYRALRKCGFRAMDSRLMLGARMYPPVEAQTWTANLESWHIAFGDSDSI